MSMATLGVTLTGALACACVALWLLRTAAEPETSDADGFRKPTYRELVTGRFAAAALVLSSALELAAATLPGWLASAWVVVAGFGTVLALCDLRTTYLPQRLMRPMTALVTMCCLVDMARAPAPLQLGVRVLAAAAVARIVFWVLWRLGAGFGFGDVRLVTVLTLPAALQSWATWYAGLFLGTLLGAGWGAVTALYRRRHPSALGRAFPYGPSLVAGAWLGLLLVH